MFLLFDIISNVSIAMVKLIAFNSQFIPLKIEVNPVFPSTKLVNHFFTVKGLHGLAKGLKGQAQSQRILSDLSN